ncbi:hypothetical protein BC332_04304 [Capsicum chinense]|nr:hypothetical protein BC332_04304 [Capsicum chinense]
MEEDTQVVKEPREHSFKEALLNKNPDLNWEYNQLNNKDKGTMACLDSEAIPLSWEDKMRIYQPWESSLIVKMYGKKLTYSYLKNNLVGLWKPTEPLTLIDLGWDYYIAKFNKHENTDKVLHKGSWFVTESFLTIKKWKSNFAPEEPPPPHSHDNLGTIATTSYRILR